MSKKVITRDEWERKLKDVKISKKDMNKLVMNFLVTEGYVDAAEKFRIESGTERILPFFFPKKRRFLGIFFRLFLISWFLFDGKSWFGSVWIASPYEWLADIDLATITDRMAVKKALQSGNVEDAIEKVNDLNPTVR